eukprot:14403591-Alexandrium_andersonii.AAC.1
MGERAVQSTISGATGRRRPSGGVHQEGPAAAGAEGAQTGRRGSRRRSQPDSGCSPASWATA